MNGTLTTIALALAAFVSLAAGTNTITGSVVGVHDGDTLTVLTQAKTQVKVRLVGIDAPESKQAFGEKSKQALSGMAFGKTVRVTVVDTDRYGRSVGDVYTGTNWVNRAMVEAGMAWHFVRYSKDEALAQAERRAQCAKRGLWRDAAPIAPWEFRREEKQKSRPDQ